MIVVLLILAAVAMLALTAFCAGAETAFLSVSRERILHLAREGGKKAKIVHKALASARRLRFSMSPNFCRRCCARRVRSGGY